MKKTTYKETELRLLIINNHLHRLRIEGVAAGDQVLQPVHIMKRMYDCLNILQSISFCAKVDRTFYLETDKCSRPSDPDYQGELYQLNLTLKKNYFEKKIVNHRKNVQLNILRVQLLKLASKNPVLSRAISENLSASQETQKKYYIVILKKDTRLKFVSSRSSRILIVKSNQII